MPLGLGNNLIKNGGAGNADKLSLDLQFAADKTLTARKGPTPTFLRASAATQVNASGLIEYAPENLYLYSQNFADSFWTKTRSSVQANVAIAPDGTLTATKLIEDTTPTNGHTLSSATTPTAIPHRLSIFAKKGERNWIVLRLGGSNDFFNLDTGVATTNINSPTITDVGNGWYRCSVVSGAGTQGSFLMSTDGTSTVYTGDGTSGIFVWGAQLERSSTARAYIPTTTAAVYGARFDHDPLTQACKGLLIEEQRINSILQSDNFASASWTQSLLTVSSNVTSSPDGSTSGDLITEDSTTGIHQINQPSPIITAGQAYTLSVFAKAASHNCFQISFPAIYGSGLFCNFILSGSGSLGNKDATSVARIESYPNGWYRCSLTAPSVVGGSASPVAILAINNNSAAVRNTSYLGTGAQVVSLWGAQLEAGAFPTSYIPTTTGPVTRSADTCSITGSDFSGFFNADDGTLFSNCSVNNTTGANRGIATIRSTAVFFMRQSLNSGSVRAEVRANDTQTNLPSTSVSILTAIKMALAYSGNNFASSTNGTSPSLVTRTLPTGLNEFRIGSLDGTLCLNGHIDQIRYFRKRLPNAKLQTLTT